MEKKVDARAHLNEKRIHRKPWQIRNHSRNPDAATQTHRQNKLNVPMQHELHPIRTILGFNEVKRAYSKRRDGRKNNVPENKNGTRIPKTVQQNGTATRPKHFGTRTNSTTIKNNEARANHRALREACELSRLATYFLSGFSRLML
jgi:uncharacterized protein YfaP (DUF2135 family)